LEAKGLISLWLIANGNHTVFNCQTMGGQENMAEKKPIFTPVSEKEVTRAIVDAFARQFIEYVESDCLIIGGGPSGLMAGRDIASKGVKTLIVERNNYIGGGFWIGGYLMNKVTVREPGQKILEELGIPYERAVKGLYVADGPHACSKLIAAACDAGVKFAIYHLDDKVLGGGNRVAVPQN
jgi:thiamine thiazole synthase